MIIEFFRRGTGKSSGPINYFLGKERNREHARVLSGDVNETADLIDSSPYVKRYTAGCLSFYESDLPADDKAKIMGDFEKALFPGLSPDNYRILWIEHRDKLNDVTGEKRLELNFLIPNIEIETGKRLQPFFAKADLERVNCFKKIVNFQHSFYDPDDPINSQATKTAKNLPTAVKCLKQELDNEISLAVCAGLISNRETLVEWLSKIGLEVTKQTRTAISIKNPNATEENARPIRLRGGFYDENFRCTSESTSFAREASERYRREAPGRYESSLRRYESLCAKKSIYHAERFGPKDRTNTAESAKQLSRYSKQSGEWSAAQENDHRDEYRKNGEQLESNSKRSEYGASADNHGHSTELAAVERIEPSSSGSSTAEKSSFFIEYSFDFNRTYFTYQQHLLRLRQQEQIQRHRRDAEESELLERTGWQHEHNSVQTRRKNEIVRTDRPNNTTLHERFYGNSRDQLNDIRSSTLANYRAATESVAIATAAARQAALGTAESLNFARSAGCEYIGTAKLHSNTTKIYEAIEREKYGTDSDNRQTEKSRIFDGIIAELGRILTTAIADTFNRVNNWIGSKKPDSSPPASDNVTNGKDRNREADETASRTAERENGLNRTLSCTFRRFDPSVISQIVTQLKQRKEIQQPDLMKRRRNDQDYSP